MALVLHGHIAGFAAVWSDPDVVKASVEWRVIKSDENDYGGTAELQINLKSLGLYRTAVQMNAQVLAALVAYVADAYNLSNFDAQYLSGGYNLLNLL